MEELADVLKIIKSVAVLYGESLDKVIGIANQKRFKKGGFERKIFLEKTIVLDS